MPIADVVGVLWSACALDELLGVGLYKDGPAALAGLRDEDVAGLDHRARVIIELIKERFPLVSLSNLTRRKGHAWLISLANMAVQQ